MAIAKTYIYRNLNRGGFSAKVRGKVVNRFGATPTANTFFTYTPEFVVSQKVSAKIKLTKQRQVHAYVRTYGTFGTSSKPPESLTTLPTLHYNPHRDTEFKASDGLPLTDVVSVVFYNDKAYLVRPIGTPKEIFEWMKDTVDSIKDLLLSKETK